MKRQITKAFMAGAVACTAFFMPGVAFADPADDVNLPVVSETNPPLAHAGAGVAAPNPSPNPSDSATMEERQLLPPAGPVDANPSPVRPLAGNPVPQSQPNRGAVSQIDPKAKAPLAITPMNSFSGVMTFILLGLICIGAGLGAAVLISLITGKKITIR